MKKNHAAMTPVVGQWFRHLDKGEMFVVVAVDEDAGTVEIQSLGGDVDEIDQESWDAMPLAQMEQPEEGAGPVDEQENGDLGYADAEAVFPDLTQPPTPLGIEAFDDTRNGAIELEAEEDTAADRQMAPKHRT